MKLVVALLGLLLATATFARAGDVKQGRALYLRYCSSCHGTKGDGHGPVAPALKTPPADLRLLSSRYGNPLPEDQIASFIDGRADIAAHGPREMPVWGERVWQYPEGAGAETQVTRRIADLVAYLQSIQAPQHHAARSGSGGHRCDLRRVRYVPLQPVRWSAVRDSDSGTAE